MKATRADVIEIGYWTRNTLEHIHSRNKTWWLHNMGGACGVGAFISWHLLKHVLGVSSTFMMGEEHGSSHCWVELMVDDSPHVLDVTATQFNAMLPLVYLETREEYYKSFFVSSMETFHADDRAFRMFHRWPETQRPMTWSHEVAKQLPGLL
jgi:hypothetical protein